MGDHRTVELFTGPYASAKLEEKYGICSVSHSLVTLGSQGVVPLPVLLAGGLLHEHKRLSLQTSHQIVAQGCIAPGSVVPGIIVPGYNIHFLCPFKIIQPFIDFHKISGYRRFFVILSDSIPFHLIIFQDTVRVKSPVINGNSCESCFLFSHWAGRFHPSRR